MMDFPTIEYLSIAIDTLPPSPLKTLLADRLADTIHCGLQDYTHVLVVEAGDTESAIIGAVGFSPFVSRIDGIRNQPDWDWLERHEGWWELLYTVGNDGFAYILLVEDAEGEPSALASLCRQHAGRVG
jgi:hypothetical protein